MSSTYIITSLQCFTAETQAILRGSGLGPLSAVAVVSEWSITDLIMVKKLTKLHVFDKFGNLLGTN